MGATSRWPSPVEEMGAELSGGELELALARMLIGYSQLRQSQFPHLTQDSHFNILIDLYISERRGMRTTVTDACIASLGPQTTALRAIAAMEDVGLVRREADPMDHRRKFLILTDEGRLEVRHFLHKSLPLARQVPESAPLQTGTQTRDNPLSR